MKLMTEEIRRSLPDLGETDGQGDDAIARLKLFTPTGRMTLYVTEFDGEDTLFGYMVSPLGPDCDEWGYSSLRELAEVRVFGGAMAGVERDRYFTPKSVRDCLEERA